MEHRFPSRLDEYYQKFLELQEKLKRSEEQRFMLESRFNETVQMAKEEEQAHYRKLRAQYKRFLEEDRKRQDRNERIMRHLERIETRIVMLSAKTERINVLRRQYQGFLMPNQLPEPRTSQPHRSNEETIQILDRYLETMSRQRSNDVLRRADPLVSTASPAASYADGILSSICSRHYNKDLHLLREKTRVSNQAEEAEKHPDPDAREEVSDPETTQIHIEPVELPQSEPEKAFEILQEISLVESFTEPEGDKAPNQSVLPEQATPELVPESVQDSCEQGLPGAALALEEAQHLKEVSIEAPSRIEPLEEEPSNQKPADDEQELCQHNEPLQYGKTEPNDQRPVDEEPKLYQQNDKPEPNDQHNVDEELEIYQQIDKPEQKDQHNVDEELELHQQNDKPEPNDQHNVDEELEIYQQIDKPEPKDQHNVDEELELYRQNDKPEPNVQHNVDEEQELYQQIESNDQLVYEQPQYDETAGYDQYGQLLLYNQHGELVPPQYDETGQILPQYDSEGLPLTLYDQNGQQYDHNRQPVVHYDANGQPVYEYYTGEEIPQYDATQLQGLEDHCPGQYYPEEEQNRGLEDYYSQPHADEVDGAQPVAENQLQGDQRGSTDQDPECSEVSGELNFPPHLEPQTDADALEESEANDQEPEAKTIPDDYMQPAKESTQQGEPEKKLDTEQPGEPNKELEMASVMDILDTDTESSKQNISKVSHDSDFDFS